MIRRDFGEERAGTVMAGRLKRIGAGTLVGTVTLAGLLAVGMGGSQAADAPTSSQLALGAISLQSLRLNVGPADPSPADRLVFSHTLTRDGKTVGLSGVECILTSVITTKTGKGKKAKTVRTATSNCTATVALTDGQIAAQGLSQLAEPGGPFTLAITGGTGKYAGATGTMTKSGPNAKGKLTLDLTTP